MSFFYMRRLPPISTRTHTLFPCTSLFRSVGGDVVTRTGRTFLVNGRPVVIAKERSRLGEPLALGPTGTIPPGCYFVGTPHKDGFDSRYAGIRSEEHTSELQSLMRNSYAVFCLTKKKKNKQ